MEKSELGLQSVRSLRSGRGNSSSDLVESDWGDYTIITPYSISHLFNKPTSSIGFGDLVNELQIDGVCGCGEINLNQVSYMKGREMEKMRSFNEEKEDDEDHLQQQEYCVEYGDGYYEYEGNNGEYYMYEEDRQYMREQSGQGMKVSENVKKAIKEMEQAMKDSGSEKGAMKESEQATKGNVDDVWITSKSGDGLTFVRRYVGDSILISQYKGLIVNLPGLVVAAGGIPDELKIDGGISFSYPAPIFRIPKKLPEDPIEREKVFFQSIEEGMGNEFWSTAMMQACMKAVGFSSIYDEQLEEDYTDEIFPTMIEVNLAMPQDMKQLDPSIHRIHFQSNL